jgi:Holliday junction resolvase
VIRKESIIVFLREMKNVPYVTIEFDYETFEVIQAYRKFNQNVDEELYQYIVDLGRQLKFEMMSRE